MFLKKKGLADMNRILVLIGVFVFLPLNGKELQDCKWKNEQGTPCLTISAPNTSKFSEES